MSEARGKDKPMIVKVRVRRGKDEPRPFTCAVCGTEVSLIELRCPNCGVVFEGWRDDTGDRGKDES